LVVTIFPYPTAHPIAKMLGETGSDYRRADGGMGMTVTGINAQK